MTGADDLILVTGGAGFIGSHLVRALLLDGHGVRVLDDFSTGKVANLNGAEALAAQNGARFQLIAGDVRDEYKMRDAVDGCSAVAHLAAVASVAQSVQDPVGADSVTHGGAVNAVRAAVTVEVPRFVLASSCAVYGDAAQLPVAETSAPSPLSPYAEAKLGAEEACTAAGDAGQLTAVCLRFFNVYGPRQDPGSEYSGVISRFLSAAAAGRPVTVYGDGEQARDFVYVGDVVDAVVAAARATRPTVVNIGTERACSVLELFGALAAIAGYSIPPVFVAPRPGDVRDSRLAIGKALRELDWRPRTTLEAGLAETYAGFGSGVSGGL